MKVKKMQKKSFSVFKGTPFKPFKHTMTFSAKCLHFFSTFIKKNTFDTKSQKHPHNKKHFFFIATSSNCCVSTKFFPMLVEMHYFGGVINSKTYLNLELGSKFFLLLLYSLEYKLMNLLVFEEKNHEQELFFFIIGLGLNFTFEFEVCCIYTSSSSIN